MTNAEVKSGMPRWLKILLIVAAVFVVITVGLGAATFFFVGKMYKDATDPVKMKQVASSFMTAKDPLPDGFEYKFAMDLMGNKIVGVNNSKADLNVVIGDLKESGDLSDPEKIINKMSATSGGAQTGSTKMKFVCEKKGSETVGGRKMTYAVGKATDEQKQKTSQVFIGLFEPTATGTAAIFGQTTKDEYDMATTEVFLKSIEKI